MKRTRTLPLGKVRITGGFWKHRTQLIVDETVPYQWDALNNRIPGAPPSHAVENFRISAGESDGKPQGTIFQDSDVAKWIEAASYGLMIRKDPELERRIDELVRLIAKSQQADGYVNTYFIAAGLEKRWSDLVMGHELYCAGHMIEAAVAYHAATGKRALLDVMRAYADYIGVVFGPAEGQNHSFDGHPEIELALNRLAEATGEKNYSRLAGHFVDARGGVKDFHVGRAAMDGMIPKSRWFLSDYYLADRPVREMTAVEGHSVRAMYLYSAMADHYLETGDPKMLDALSLLWKNAVSRHMYITAGLGSQSHGERFTLEYDLPNDTCYTETCASIGLAFWAWRMHLIEPKGEYADVIERAMYNGILAGISLDGKKYFYVNPLEVKPEVARTRHDQAHVATERVSWFDCACCPTNVARFVASVGGYAASSSDEAVLIHQYIAGSFGFSMNGTAVAVTQETNYPWSGLVRIAVDPAAPASFALHVRIPAWCGSYSLRLNGTPVGNPEKRNGYAAVSKAWKKGDVLELDMEMPVRLVRANSLVRENAGKAAIQRGPLVYCLEEADNGPGLHSLVLDPTKDAVIATDGSLIPDTVVIDLAAFREKAAEADAPLYADSDGGVPAEACRVRAVPYFQWGNRAGNQEMLVWVRMPFSVPGRA